MEKYFRTEQGKLVDILDYTIQRLSKDPDVKIHIGTDSQVKGGEIHYVICIVYRVGKKGAHFIYKKIKKDRPPKTVSQDEQVNMRLNEEVYMTMEIAQFLQSNTSIHIESVEFDFNFEPEHISNRLTSMATGWAKGVGFNAKIKPDELIACRAADHICRKQ
jgi:predicted RNase H-related nuclease YkuK (DUF458 family)